MSRISMIQPDQATGAAAEIFSKIKKAIGKVPNAYMTIGTHNPEALGALLTVDEIVSRGTLSKQDTEAINLAVSEAVGCNYCVAAHTAIGKMVGLSDEATRQIRAGQPTDSAKRDALVRFVRNLVLTHGTVSDEEFSAVIGAGYTQAELVDISLAVSAITFTNAINRISDTTLDFPKIRD
ncbi:carboxymuconolactone decarboxylase family protein [Caballeronia sordidicola]|uniref:Macrophage infectivity potentiator-related protein n=1 Tax=Caballeronia sordidicola TaxID=196367 RepID=A0A242M8J7_CABSO|nr:carboxymuconolactone decarboxylase family protein [Caballeronia sordidicola]OTP67420.1 Macrophage infectivity potentiator-related protein [Caballeronia sordidicola]